MKNAIYTITLGLSLSSALWANPSLTQDFKSLLTKYKVGALVNQSYCYKDSTGAIDGYQVSKMMPIASVTKLFTTYFASELLDLNKRYTTKIHIKGDSLHIEGGNDPYFEEEKMLLLMKALNEKGYSRFKTVSFDKNFLFTDVALGEYQVITAAHTKSKIALYFNTDLNRSYIHTKWKGAVKFAEEEGVRLEADNSPQMVVSKVNFVDKNPIEGEEEIIFTHRSKPLHSLLKSMNVMSKNLVAHHVFDEASVIQNFNDFMKSRGFDTTKIIFYNGSGLPVKTSKTRKDNLTSCSVVVNLINKLHESLRAKGFRPEDIIAVNGGKDNGSFRERFLDYPELNEAILSKTGTLAISSSLAGTLETTNGEIQFGIINKPASSTAARKFQDNFVERMFHYLGEAAPIPYEKLSIFPWDDSEYFEI